MNEDLAAFEKALETFLKVFRGDVMEIVDKGALPISYIIAFREPSLDGFETIQYIARSTRGCPPGLARMFHELQSRDRGEGRVTGQPRGVGPEAYLNGTSQGATPEDARKDGHIRGRSR